MKRMIQVVTAVSLAGAALAASAAYNPPDASRAVDEVITITPGTNAVGVYRDDVVRFVVRRTGSSFVETFDANSTPLDLSRIAPDGALDGQHVTVYVWDRTGEA